MQLNACIFVENKNHIKVVFAGKIIVIKLLKLKIILK